MRFAYNTINKTQKDVIYMRETRTLEFKETITNTFLKQLVHFPIMMAEPFILELMMMETSRD